MDTKIEGTISTLSTKAVINAVGIMVGNPWEWLPLLVSGENRISSSFENFVVLFYVCLFTRIGLRLPFSEFEVVVLKYLKFSPSQLHLGSWAYIKVFQLCADHKSGKFSLSLSFDLFHLRRTSMDNFRNQGVIYFHLFNLWFDPFTLDRGDFLEQFLLVKPTHPHSISFFVTSLLIFLASIRFCIQCTGPRSILTRTLTRTVPSQVLFFGMRG